MKHLVSLSVFLVAVLLSVPAMAGNNTEANIQVDDAWARATAEGALVGAAYLTLSTSGAETDRLVAASSPVAGRVELHTHLMEDGVMKMRRVEAIEVAPGTPTVLEPGALHIMLIGLQTRLKEGEQFPLTLTFEKAGDVEIEVPVRSARQMGSKAGG